jgi:acyl dehydratase
MKLRWTGVTHSAEQTKAGTRVTLRFVLTDEHDVPVVEHFWSNLYFGTTIQQPAGPALADHAFPEDARARLLGERSFPVARDQTYRYAGASGDNGDMHVSDEAARGYGLPSKILQGLCTFGMCSAAVVDLAAGGDPTRLRRLACRFSASTFPGNDVAVALYDAGETPEGARAVAFEASSGDATVIKHGRAEIAP